MEGTSRLIFNLGAHLLTKEPCQGAEVHDNRAAVLQPLGWGRRACSQNPKGCFADFPQVSLLQFRWIDCKPGGRASMDIVAYVELVSGVNERK